MYIKIVRNGLAYYIDESAVPSLYAAGASTRAYKEAAEFVVDVRENKVIKSTAKLEEVVDSHFELMQQHAAAVHTGSEVT